MSIETNDNDKTPKYDDFAQKIVKEPRAYDERYVAFIDIIGFRSLIGSNSAAWIKRNIYDEIRTLDTLLHTVSFDHELSDASFHRLEFVIISDSVIISIPITADRALDVLLIACVKLQEILFLRAEPILIRGGISSGEYLHFDQVTFGPALVKAFILESEIAIYPRIVIDKNIDITKIGNSTNLMMLPICMADSDGYQYINYILFSMLTTEDKKNSCTAIRDYIQSSREKYVNDERKYAKYNWLASKYNDALSRLIKGSSGYEENSPLSIP